MLNSNILLNSYFAVYSYIWVVVILLLFILYINIYTTILMNTNFKLFYTTNFIKFNFFFFLLSLAGVPPLLGFLNKIFILNILLNTNNMILLILFVIINTFLLVFYIQQVKFLQTSNKKIIFNKINSKHNLIIIQFFIICQFINQFAMFILPNFILLTTSYIIC